MCRPLRFQYDTTFKLYRVHDLQNVRLKYTSLYSLLLPECPGNIGEVGVDSVEEVAQAHQELAHGRDR